MDVKLTLSLYLQKTYGIQPSDITGTAWVGDYDAIEVTLKTHDKIWVSGINLNKYMMGST
jgi:hypothetical protein